MNRVDELRGLVQIVSMTLSITGTPVASPAAQGAGAIPSPVARTVHETVGMATLAVPPPLEVPLGAASGPGFDAERATRAWLDTLSGEARARSDRYFVGGYWLMLWDTLTSIAACLLLLATRVAARMRRLAERVTRRTWLQPALVAVQFAVASAVLTFPLTLYARFFRERDYGLLNQTFGPWLADQGKALLVSTLMLGLAVTTLYAALRRAPRAWARVSFQAP
jgi:STE24 endopeptidase